MFENDEDMESEIVTKCEFYPKVCLSKASLSMHEKEKHQQHSTFDSVSNSDSGGLRSRLELTDFS